MKALSDTKIRSLSEPGRHTDGTVPGLYLEVSEPRKDGKPGSKLWRLKYRLHGKENRYAIGAYPDITLARARELAQEARTSVANGVAPLKAKTAKVEAQKLKETHTFKAVAEKFLLTKAKLAEKTLAGYRGGLENHIYPLIGDLPIADVNYGHALALVDRLSDSTAMVKHVLSLLKMVLDHAEGRFVEGNALAGRRIKLPTHKKVSRKALEDPVDLGNFLCLLDEYPKRNGISVLSALRLLTLLPVRPVELVGMRWQDVNFEEAKWVYKVSKTDRFLQVPLQNQALEILRTLKAESLTDWVFPSPMHAARHIARDSLLAGLIYSLGCQRGSISAHGFRATYRTLGEEELGIDPIVLELALGHKMPGVLGDTYARAQLLDKRRAAAQQWADYLDQLKAGALRNA
ncbi:tyrosine-type recombinase/integrase [Pseudomonas sp. GL-RE-19]|uniref:tyrosine-type recombinase/integrase n=1 Tax=Pseudomonas sp. GL-RE-19 TaxID=2832389 RepID=UPI001CBAD45E|nr:site-specific integrase [Pseudomonas sp. GL-RE-19]